MLGEIGIELYQYVVLAAAAAGVVAFLALARSSGVPPARAALFNSAIGAAGLVGGRLYWLIESGTHWEWSALWGAGYRHPGSILAVIVATPLLRRLLIPRISLPRLGDLMALSAVVSFAIIRLGCFAAGCCFGTTTSLPWGVPFPVGSPAANLHGRLGWIPPTASASLAVHPLELYFLLLAVAVGVFLYWFRRRQTYDGQLMLLFLLTHETGKFLLEGLRGRAPDDPAGLLPFVSLALASVAAAALIAIRLRTPTVQVPGAGGGALGVGRAS